MSSQVMGIVKLKYSSEGDLQIGIFKPMINVDKDKFINSELSKCRNKSIDEMKDLAELLLAGFFSKVSDIELRDMEKSEIKTIITHSEKYPDGTWKEVDFEFVYID